MSVALAESLARVRGGERLTPGEAERLYREAPLGELRELAHERRCQGTDPRVVTYLVDRNVNYANECVTGCRFCAFHREEGHPEAYVIEREELRQKLRELEAIGGTRILLQGGCHPRLRLPWFLELVAWVREQHPTIEVNAFSPTEIHHLAQLEGLDTPEVLRRLQEVGLTGLPGGGAEILDDALRARLSPRKVTAARWLQVMEEAQRQGLTTTATMVIGWGETLAQRVAHLERLRQVQDRALADHGNGFTAFIAWTAQLRGTELDGAPPVGREEYLRNLALARLYLDGVPHLQASWPTMGEAVAAEALRGGADDYGSTMMEENVVSAAGAPQRRIAVTRMEERIRAAGFTPAQRDTRYRILRYGEGPA